MKRTRRVLAALGCLVMLAGMLASASADDGFRTSYTYTYDYWGEVQSSPDAYRVATVIDSGTLGMEKLNDVRIKNPRILFVQEIDGVSYLYLCDTDNNRILEIIRDGNQFTLSRVIDRMTGADEPDAEAVTGETEAESPDGAVPEVDVPATGTDLSDSETETPATSTDLQAAGTDTPAEGGTETEDDGEAEAVYDPNLLSQPYDVSVDPEGNIYVADYGNQRVVKMDRNLKFIQSFVKPTDATFDQGLRFLPKRLVVDVAGRVYALCQNVNKGLVKYEANGEFSGFIGANTVSVSMFDYIWKRYFMSKEQRAKSESFVPTEYENIYIDKEGFIYATNTVFDENDLMSGGAKPIRRLNSLGTDILIKNDRYPPIGDLDWVYGTDNASKDKGPSRFIDITVLNNDIYVALDSTRGRLFGYDSQGIMLWAFGTKGNTNGAFNGAVSIEHMGYDLLVLDNLKNSVTVFTPTEYGRTIYEASETYLDGEYDLSAELWQDVLKMNTNYPLAFRGIGRAILRQNEYKEAMDYFELAHDRENYGKAFKLYRKEWIEKNVLWIVLILAALLLIPLIRGRIKRLKWEVNEYERSKIRK